MASLSRAQRLDLFALAGSLFGMNRAAEAVGRAERAIRLEAARHLQHAAVILYGSRARGEAGRRSDFDLAIVPKDQYTVREKLAFIEALDESSDIIYPVDVIDFFEAAPELKRRISEEGIMWKD